MASAIHSRTVLALLGLCMLAGTADLTALGAEPLVDARAGMVAVPAGRFTPLYASGSRAAGTPPPTMAVEALLLDATPVTNGQFLAFVRTHPRWQRSQVSRILAESTYLAHWAADDVLGNGAPAGSPVTYVSWFAAKAYCAAQGKRLPTTAQWEYAAAASATQPNGEDDPEFRRAILEWYSRPNPERLPDVGHGFRNYWGVFDLHGLVWEWTLDFSTALVTGESRGDSALERDLFCGAAAVGASDFRDYAAFLRYGYRSSLNASYTIANLGFRCAAPSS